jgi:ATP-dependent Clp protease ATP-binding subunit ClpC
MNYQKMKEHLQAEVDKFFRPEFLNRLDDVIVFKSLTKEDISAILDIEMRGIIGRLRDKKIALVLEQEARDFIIEKGTNLEFGARPLRRAIERFIEDPLAEEILKNTFEGKNVIDVKLADDKIVFEAGTREEPTEQPPEVPVNSP